jgi:hypothetical protein
VEHIFLGHIGADAVRAMRGGIVTELKARAMESGLSIKDEITLIISAFALATSLLSFSLSFLAFVRQNKIRNALSFRMVGPGVTLPDPQRRYGPRSLSLDVELVFYNLGNRQVAINRIAMMIRHDPPLTIPDAPGIKKRATTFPQISRPAKEVQLFAPFVVEQETIGRFTGEFDITANQTCDDEFTLKGDVELEISVTDVRGKISTISCKAIKLDINLNLHAQDDDRFGFDSFKYDLVPISFV